MKQAITIRIDPGLLQAAKLQAASENRTLTNFLETLLRAHLAGSEKKRDTRSIVKQRTGTPKAVHVKAPNLHSEKGGHG